jgi:UDP-N-acetylglucosamine:LPS N-acetylglucosamine transferase
MSNNSNISIDYRIAQVGNDRYLITNQGEVLKEQTYSTNFEKELAEKLMDTNMANHISSQLHQHIAPKALGLYKGDLVLHEWREALKYYAPLLGADPDYMLATFKEHAHEDVKQFINNHPEEAKQFFQGIAQSEQSQNKGLTNKSKKIVILDSSSGGGHIATAEAVKKMMEARGFKAQIINQDELRKERDPLIVGGVKYKGQAMSMAEVYNRVFQQDNDSNAAHQLWSLGNEIRKFEPNREAQSLVETIRKINPAMIFSVATHHPEHASLSNRTGIPLKYVHTDFDFNNALVSMADKVDKKLINFWVNADDTEILQGKKIGNWEVPLAHLKDRGVIQVCGYPLRPSFVRETDPKKLAAIKNQKNIPSDHRVALLAMGRQGIRDHIVKYMRLLQDPNQQMDKPLHLVVVCGKNADLKKELEDYVKGLLPHEKNPNVHFKIEGFVEEKDMADYFKVADALISKPGGATAAEAAAMGVPLLSCEPHPWEYPNQEYLKRHGLAEKLESDDTFRSQLQDLMQRKEEGISYQPLDWKKQFATLIDAKKNQNPVKFGGKKLGHRWALQNNLKHLHKGKFKA